MDKAAAQHAVAVELTEAAPSAEMRVGQQLRLTLPETPSTGYRWRIADACSSHLSALSDTFTPPDGKPGAAGSHTWLFTATAAGVCTLKLQAARPWESGPATGRALSFTVKIAE